MAETTPTALRSPVPEPLERLVLRPKRKNDTQLGERRRKAAWAYLVCGGVLLHNVFSDPAGTLRIAVPSLVLVIGIQALLGAMYFGLATVFVEGNVAGKTNILGQRRSFPRQAIAAILLVPVQLHKFANPTPHHVIGFVNGEGASLFRLNAQYWSMADITRLGSALNVPVVGSWDDPPVAQAAAEARNPGICSWYERNNEGVTAASLILVFPVVAFFVWLVAVLHL